MSKTRMTSEEFKKLKQKKRGKWNAVRVNKFGYKFRSKLEAAIAEKLEELKRTGVLVNYAYETSFLLPGNIRHMIDFTCFWSNGYITFVEAKGKDLAPGKMKRHLFEDLYQTEVEVVTKITEFKGEPK